MLAGFLGGMSPTEGNSRLRSSSRLPVPVKLIVRHADGNANLYIRIQEFRSVGNSVLKQGGNSFVLKFAAVS